ncbi:MAG: hypothetical protein ACRD2T_02815 [Thermoanaerobaculia bacterium]
MRNEIRCTVWVVAAACVLAAGAGSAAAQDQGSLRFEKTVRWQLDKRIPLDATVGPVKVASVEFRKGGSGGGGGVLGRLRGASETEASLRASFDTQNTSPEQWVVTYTLDFLDENGKLIDRASGKKGFEGEADTYHLDHAILEYVLPFIDRVKVRLEARLD